MGPLINRAAVEKVNRIVQADVEAGATVETGGTRLSDVGANFFAPTVLTGCTDDMRVAKENIRSGRSALFVRNGGGGGPTSQRHRGGTRVVLLHEGHGADLPGRQGPK